MSRTALILAAIVLAAPLAADPSVIEGVAVSRSGMGWRFDVTVRHGDTGWDHYADAWQVLAPDGTVLATRELLHPHEDEQPFTRSLTDVAVPDGLRSVIVQAKCSNGDVSAPFTVKLSR